MIRVDWAKTVPINCYTYPLLHGLPKLYKALNTTCFQKEVNNGKLGTCVSPTIRRCQKRFDADQDLKVELIREVVALETLTRRMLILIDVSKVASNVITAWIVQETEISPEK